MAPMLFDAHDREITGVTDAGGGAGYSGRHGGRTPDGSKPRVTRLINRQSGQGTQNDKTLWSQFVPRVISRTEAETAYQMSWALAKLIDIPVDDMFIRGRRWKSDDKSAIKSVEEAERELGLMANIAGAMKAGRLFGTGLLVVCTDDGKFADPLDTEKVKEGSLANLWVTDRWSAAVENWQIYQTLPHFGQPHQYRIQARVQGNPAPIEPPAGVAGPAEYQNMVVHKDRVVRFDGTRAPLTEGWVAGVWEREWGVSMVTRVVDEILRDEAMHMGIGYLMEEASVWVNKIQGFKDSLLGQQGSGEAEAEDIAEKNSLMRSLYRTVFMDSEDDANRIGVTFAGIADLMDRQNQRLAAMGDIPVTRFMSQSPSGMNATGSSDAQNYAMAVQANQEKMAEPAIRRLDPLIARHVGLKEPLEYEWVPLFNLSEKDQAEISKLRTETIMLALEGRAMDESEVRERLSEDEFSFGPLKPNWEPPEPEIDPGMVPGNGNAPSGQQNGPKGG